MIEYNINRILVPVDFSSSSLNALDTAIAMAKRHNATVVLMNVVETGGLSGIQAEGYDCEADALIALTHHSEQQLHKLQHSVTQKFLVSCETIAATGTVAAAIIKISSSHRIDLIVMGTHGTSGFRESLIGLNAFNVVKNSVCPVLTIPPVKKWDVFRKILFPVRPIPAALEKYDFVRKIIRKGEATLKILGLATDYEKDGELMKELSAQLNEKLRDDEVEASTYFKVGENMAHEVLKIAALMEAELIVITATIDSAFNQFIVGPYTQHILNYAHFPVLSIKPIHDYNREDGKMQQIRQSFEERVPLYN